MFVDELMCGGELLLAALHITRALETAGNHTKKEEEQKSQCLQF